MAKKLSTMRWWIGQAVIEPWTLWSTFGSTNRSVTWSTTTGPTTRSAVRDIAALPTAFLSFGWRCSYLADWLLMMSRCQRRCSDYWYNFGVKGQGQVYLKPVLQLVTWTTFIFYGRCSYLAHLLLMVCSWKKGFGLPIKGQDEIYLATELADAMVIG